jgi:NAD(P)-dependent dehydrogenase (short-subunit alcohol dehydrogenase family)
MTSLTGRIALITGASRGIGAAVAKRFAQEGAHVILPARDVAGLEATDDAIRKTGGSATLVELDLSDPARIELLAEQIAQRFGRLDILVGNAGVLTDLSPLPHIAPDDWDKAMAINLTANWHLIRCFDALLKTSDAGRAIFVTSGVTKRAASYWGGYAVSKAALEAMVEIYAAENAKSALRANLIDPGAVRTRMRAQAYPGEDPMELPEPDAVCDIFLKLAQRALQETGQKFFVNP